MIAERELFSFLPLGKFCPFFIPVGQSEMPALFQKKDHKIGEQKQHKIRKCRHFVNVDPELEDRECQKEYKEQIHVFRNTDI